MEKRAYVMLCMAKTVINPASTILGHLAALHTLLINNQTAGGDQALTQHTSLISTGSPSRSTSKLTRHPLV